MDTLSVAEILSLALDGVAGLLLGGIAATVHVGLLRRRISWLVRGRRGLAFALYPLGVLLAAAALLGAFVWSMAAGWAAVLGLLVVELGAAGRERSS